MTLKMYELKFKKSPRARKEIIWHRYAHDEAQAKSSLIETCLREFGKRPVILSLKDKGEFC